MKYLLLDVKQQTINYFFIRFTIFHILDGCHIWSRNFPEHLISTPVFSGVHVVLLVVFCVVFCRSMFVQLYFFFLAIALSVLRCTPSDYTFWTFKLFLDNLPSDYPFWTFKLFLDNLPSHDFLYFI